MAVLSEFLRVELRCVFDEDTLLLLATRRRVDFAAAVAPILATALVPPTTTQMAVLDELLTGAQLVWATPRKDTVALPLNPQLAGARSLFCIPATQLPTHLLQLAQAVLAGQVTSNQALRQSGDMQTILGNNLGEDEDEFPAQAYAVAAAAAEALNQALGLGPFDHQEITPQTSDAMLLGAGAAAAPAHHAACGIFDGVYATDAFDPLAQQTFWTWWLTKALPAAWTAEADAPEAQGPTMPFEQTVRISAYRYGTINGDDL
jgi:hypothetical protein